jgi:hypothetical protein
MSNQTCGQVSGSSAGSSVPVVGSSSPVVASPFPKSNPMFDIGRSTPKPLFVAGASDPPTPNPFSTEVRDPKFIPNPGLRAAGRSQRCIGSGISTAISDLSLLVERSMQHGLPRHARRQRM